MSTFKNIFLSCIIFSAICFCQNKDTTIVLGSDSNKSVVVKNDKKMSKPARAALLSAIVPGLGQAYNRSYWKIPIVYALVGGSAYMMYYNHKQFKDFDFMYTRFKNPELLKTTKAYRNVDTTLVIQNYGNYSESSIQLNASYHRDWRDKFAIITVMMYAANIIEAHVDAHLKDFNVSEDVSMRVSPSIMPTVKGWQSSVELSFTFKNKSKRFDENSTGRLW